MIDASVLPELPKEHADIADASERMWIAHMFAREKAYERVFESPITNVLTPPVGQLTVNWPGGAVIAFPPTEKLRGFTYVTHGLSQPGRDALMPQSGDEPSNWGLEYVISTPTAAEKWAPLFLLDCVAALLFSNAPRPFLPGERAKSAILAQRSGSTTLGALIAVASTEYDGDIRLPGGFCQLVHFVGVTPAELEQAKALGPTDRGTRVLLRALGKYGHGFLTDPARSCITTKPDFASVWAAQTAAVDAEG